MTYHAKSRFSSNNVPTIRHFGAIYPMNTENLMTTDAETSSLAQSRGTGEADGEWIREDERQRIARDIHDEMGQQLLVLRMDVLRLRDRIADTHPQLQAIVGDVQKQLDTTIQSMRAAIRGLRPAVLDLGLRGAVEWYCTEFIRRSGITCDLTWKSDELVVPDCYATVLFRTLQESLTNVYRHAHASRVSITIQIANDNIVMMVSDDGVGGVPADAVKMNTFGLSGMRERIAALGGDLDISNATPKGMTLMASLPL